MNGHTLYANISLGSIGFLIHGQLLQFVQRFQSVDHFAEDGVFPVEIRLFAVGDEELRPVRIRPSASHRDHTTLAVLNDARGHIAF